jgi:hypothetical protein
MVLMGGSQIQCSQAPPIKYADKIDFNFDVRPILVQNCYLCHGPDISSRKANLRLDTFEGATAKRDGGKHAVIPGNSGKSEMIKRISHEDLEIRMPPLESNLKLTNSQIDILRKWIDQGAEWKPHWAFIKPTLEEPEKHDSNQSANEIDDFVWEKLVSQNLEPAPRANKNTLIRRVSYILTGLPPTAEKIDEFVNDSSSDAYENMVDSYLNSNGFGERWARHWMDIVRYAETKGHEFDYPIIGAWKYRDYLIRAFNKDIPYDQLVKEHLAGDLIEDVRWNPETGINESQIGTAFYALGEGTHSPVDIRKDEADRIDNMIDVTTKTFQGLTVSCARCHDHKFDPIPTADYYALYGVMESSRFSNIPSKFSLDQLKSLEEIANVKGYLKELIAEEWSNQAANVQTTAIAAAGNAKDYTILGDFREQDLDGWNSDGLGFGKETTLGAPEFDEDGKLLGLSEGKASSKFYTTGIFGALRSPNFIIDKDSIGLYIRGNKSTARIIIDNFQLIQNPIYGGLSKGINTEEWKKIGFNIGDWKGHKAYIEVLPGAYNRHHYKFPKSAFVEIQYAISFDSGWPETIAPKHKEPVSGNQLLANWKSSKSSAQEVAALNKMLNSEKLANEFSKTAALRAKRENLTQKLIDSTFFTGINEGFGVDSPIFIRGNHIELSEDAIPRGFLSAVTGESAAFKTKGSGRMELAEAILSPDNPLTSRIMVNRIWHHLFGKGIVETVDNFGLQGTLPSHPKLLDYLAIKFQNEGWSIKNMIKYIVMSNTFQRSVIGPENSKIIDPNNNLLSHFPLRRLESEAIWDGILAVSGNLNPKMYGEPVPVYLTRFMQGRGKPAKSGPLDGNGRRSIYQDVRRNFLQPLMLTFDRPIPFSTFGKRNSTNVPAQSLVLMNDPFIIQQAEMLAKDVMSQKDLNQSERINYIYIKLLSRTPSKEEVGKANAFIELIATTYDLEESEITSSPEVWKDYCHSVFNLKEFIYLL